MMSPTDAIGVGNKPSAVPVPIMNPPPCMKTRTAASGGYIGTRDQKLVSVITYWKIARQLIFGWDRAQLEDGLYKSGYSDGIPQ